MTPLLNSPFHREFQQREFQYLPDDFERVRALIYQHTGIRLKVSKEHMVYSRLARRLRATEHLKFGDYLDFAESDAREWQNFINALTTNLTAFFREPHHFSILSNYLKKTAHSPSPNCVSLWCAAASTGEEAYSMAMTAVEAFGTLTPPVKILATDLDTQVLEIAQAGVFALDRVKKLPADQLKRFFLKGEGESQGYVKVREELRALITFRQLNLLDPEWNLRTPFSAIFCRNVMIYFDKPTQYKILKKFVPLLRADALLFAGHSENFYHATDLFTACGKTVYRLKSSPPKASTDAVSHV